MGVVGVFYAPGLRVMHEESSGECACMLWVLLCLGYPTNPLRSMNRRLNVGLGKRPLASLDFVYTTPTEGYVTLTFYRPAEGDFGDLTPPVVPEYTVQQEVAHPPLGSWAETLAHDQELFRQHLQTYPGEAVDVDQLNWEYPRPTQLSRYVVYNGEGQATGVLDAEFDRQGYSLRLRSLLDTARDFDWYLPHSPEGGNGVEQLLAEGKIPDGRSVLAV